ncbi:MAG: hypothetical protein PUK18_00410 [Firmicutes bacterium]|nr:hypothetical protein [Bacillota bacterium]MDY6161315.1 hypothetical protein [Candidatus Faecousia sp.]
MTSSAEEVKEFYKRFPVILRDKLINGEVLLPDDTQFLYEPIKTYRAVEREKEDFREVTIDDFRSYFELNKTPKRLPRGVSDITKYPLYYGASSYLSEEKVRQQMHFPNPKKKLAEGYVFQEGGPQQTRISDGHVCWWLYEGTDVSGFQIREDKEG